VTGWELLVDAVFIYFIGLPTARLLWVIVTGQQPKCSKCGGLTSHNYGQRVCWHCHRERKRQECAFYRKEQRRAPARRPAVPVDPNHVYGVPVSHELAEYLKPLTPDERLDVLRALGKVK
jgi:hypothetical protein